MQQKDRWPMLIAVILILPFLLLIGSFRYRVNYAKTEVVTSASDDGKHSLTVYMIGEPDWPFGATHCRFDLWDGSKRIAKEPFSIHDDGAAASENNFVITWQEDRVEILVTASEQPDELCAIYFDGMVGWMKKDKV